MNWREFPMARLLLPLILGILLGNFWGIGRIDIFWLLLSLACTLFLVGMQAPIRYIRRWWYGIALHLFLLLTGFLLCSNQQARPTITTGENILLGEILQLSQSTSKQRVLLQVYEQAIDSAKTQSTQAKVLVYIDQSANSDTLQVGDQLLCQGYLMDIPAPLNPNAFDYQAYMAMQEVYYQVFVAEGDWQYLGHRNSIFRFADSWRTYFLSILKTHLPGINEYAVGAALSLGYKSEITEEVRAAYANTGAMHVLAVSGLHVGLVQLMISWLLSCLRFQHRYWSLLKTIITIIGIWSFAILAGGAPSVLRAATMFSFLAIGLALHRFTNIYNTLAASAFLLLCIQPNLLFNIGFQLSYLAVLGIVYFQPMLYRLWYIKYSLGDYIWKLTTVSIAAQLATLPISIYYFHQFPIYFFLSGLIVVPAAALILILSISLFAFHSLPLLAFILGSLLNGLLKIVNGLIFLIQQLPAGLLTGLWIGSVSVIIMYGLLLLIITAINTKRYAYLQFALAGALLLAMTYAYREWETTHQEAVVVYHVKGKTLVDYFDGQICHSLTIDSLTSKDIKYAAQQHRWYRHAQAIMPITNKREIGNKNIWKLGAFAQMGNLKVAIPKDRPFASDSLPIINLDLLILTGGSNINLEHWSDYLRPKKVVIDGSASFYEAKAWKESCEKLAWPIHQTKYNGALIINNSDL